jgi:hypothetical protein
MADLFWSVATSYLALSIITVVLVAAWLVGHVPFGKYAPIVGPYIEAAKQTSFLLFGLLAFLIGHRIADEKADMRQLQAKLEQTKIDLKYSDHQLAVQKASADEAARLREQAQQQADQANQKVSEYEERLAKQPASNGCNLDDGDVRSLHDIAR